MRPPLPVSVRRCQAFTLLEVLISVIVISILVTLATVSLLGSLASQQLGASAFRLAGDIAQASQIATTESRSVALTFVEERDLLADPAAPPQVRGWRLDAANPTTGALEQVTDVVRLQSGVVVMSDVVFSTLLSRPRPDGEPCRIRFKADGSTDLPTGDQQRWCITLALESDVIKAAGNLPPNSRTVVINAFTGAVTVY